MHQKIIKLIHKKLKLDVAVNFRKGNGKTLVIIHGLMGCKEFYDDIWKIEEYKNFSILIIDLVGFGYSSKSEKFSYSMEEQAKICIFIIEKFNLDRINLICHSMGGAIGLILSKKIPDKIVSFISLEGCMIGKDLSISRTASNVSFLEFKNKTFKKIIKKIKQAENENRAFWKKWKCKSSSLAFYNSSKSLVKWCDSGKLLRIFLKLKIKKSYFYGERNSKMPVLNLIKGKCKLIYIKNTGHFMMVDNPQDFYSELLKIIAS